MPIVDIELVGANVALGGDPPAQRFADTIAQALGSRPGRTWVRLRNLDRSAYAENGGAPSGSVGPVFVTVLHAHPPTGAALAAEVVALTRAIADCSGRPPELVHVRYAAAAAGRQAFGGRLVE